MTALRSIPGKPGRYEIVDSRSEQTFSTALKEFRSRHPHRIIPTAVEWLGNWELGRIDNATAIRYGNHRAESPAAADKELDLVSAVVYEATGRKPFLGRRRIHKSDAVRHSREVMPVDGDEIHALARVLFREPRSAAIGWQLILQTFTGLRTSELLALRMDATGQEPGAVSGGYLFVRRSKSGRFPFVEIHPALAEALEAHRRWHTRSPWYLPGRDGEHALNNVALTHALSRLSPRKVTAHGCRAWFVTWQRSLGRSDAQVAALIGDRTVDLISRVYGDLPQAWVGGKPLNPMPTTGEPAWN